MANPRSVLEGHYDILYFHENVAASDTDEPLIAAVAGRKIRVLSLSVSGHDTASDITFESDGASDTELHKVQGGANTQNVLPFNPGGWFETLAGEGLIGTTGAGGEINVTGSYIVV